MKQQKNYEAIKKEFLSLQSSLFHNWPERELYVQEKETQSTLGQGWEVV